MKRLIYVLLLFTFVGVGQEVLPTPTSYKKGTGKFSLTENTRFQYKGESIDAKMAFQRFIKRLQNRSGVFLTDAFIKDTLARRCVSLSVKDETDSVYLGMDESYGIKIETSQIRITSQTPTGAIRAFETLLQLIQTNKEGAFFAQASINDSPRFKWRGLLIDVCRHWISLPVIKRNIDAMAACKMNVLHLHLTEDQAFRIESKAYPLLHQKGNDGNYFTQNQIKNLIKYARERGIRVVPEFDIPGHATSWVTAYPDLASAKGPYQLEKNYGVFDPTLDPTREETYYFLKVFLTEMAELFADEYIHIGGDENKGLQWNQNKDIQEFMEDHELKNNHELQSYFNTRILEILKENGKRMMGWDEIYQKGIPNNIVIQSWRGKESLIKAAAEGYPSILSNGFYLDKVFDTKTYYENDPIPNHESLPDSVEHLILGGEATMWSELVDEKTIDSRIWPVTAGIAERLWSKEEDCNTNQLYIKLPKFSNSLEEFGLEHLSFQNHQIRTITKSQNTESLIPFFRILEPIKGYTRHRFIKYNTSYPLKRMPDACLTESKEAIEFRILVLNNCRKNGLCKDRDKIKKVLREWIKSTEAFIAVSENTPVSFEAKPLAIKIQELLEISWSLINSPNELGENQKDRARDLIKEIEEFNLDVKFAPIDVFHKLFD